MTLQGFNIYFIYNVTSINGDKINKRVCYRDLKRVGREADGCGDVFIYPSALMREVAFMLCSSSKSVLCQLSFKRSIFIFTFCIFLKFWLFISSLLVIFVFVLADTDD